MSPEPEQTRWWSPPGAWSPQALAVPLKPGDKELTWDQYVARLGNRVNQMLVDLYPDQQQLKKAYSQGWLEEFGVEPSSDDPLFHPLNPDFEDRLSDLGIGLDDFPQKVSQEQNPATDQENDREWDEPPVNDFRDWLAELSRRGGSLD